MSVETVNRVEKNGTEKPAARPPAKKAVAAEKGVTISAPNTVVVRIPIRGTAPLVVNAFNRRPVPGFPDFVPGLQKMLDTQMGGKPAGNKKVREPKNLEALFLSAQHVASEKYGGWKGIHAGAFRSAMIDACRLVGFKMTVAKLAVFVVADGYEDDGTGLVKITKGEPRMHIGPVRNESGVADVRARPMWDEGWEAVVSVRVDLGQFEVVDAINLLSRAGVQVGICEGRPNSKNSHGCGWGTFEVVSDDMEMFKA